MKQEYKILFLSYYFEPDLSAGSFRNTMLAYELAQQFRRLSGVSQIDVITTKPNRYASFALEAQDVESKEGISIYRIKTPKHTSGMLDQSFSFWHYYKAVLRITRDKKYDLIYASSSRLFTAYLGSVIARKQSAPLYLDIRDIFVDTMADVLGNTPLKKIILPILSIIENITLRRAFHINLVSEGFKDYFAKWSSGRTFFTNGIDPFFMKMNHNLNKKPNNPLKIVYAGNIGEGQGLHRIVPHLAEVLKSDVIFQIIGDGGMRAKLEEEIKRRSLDNVQILPPVKRTELDSIYRDADFLFVHLNDYKAFEKVLPSKLFELATYPQPLIFGVGGYARKFVEQHISNCIIFEPCNAEDFLDKWYSFSYQLQERKTFIHSFSREKIGKDMVKSILSLWEQA